MSRPKLDEQLSPVATVVVSSRYRLADAADAENIVFVYYRFRCFPIN